MVPQVAKKFHAFHGARISISCLLAPLPISIPSQLKQSALSLTLYSRSLPSCTLGHPASLSVQVRNTSLYTKNTKCVESFGY